MKYRAQVQVQALVLSRKAHGLTTGELRVPLLCQVGTKEKRGHLVEAGLLLVAADRAPRRVIAADLINKKIA